MYIPAFIICSSLYNSTRLLDYTSCMAREEGFFYMLPNFLNRKPYEVNRIDLPFFHPYRVLINIQMVVPIFTVPILYAMIYKFRKNHDLAINGNKIVWIFQSKNALLVLRNL